MLICVDNWMGSFQQRGCKPPGPARKPPGAQGALATFPGVQDQGHCHNFCAGFTIPGVHTTIFLAAFTSTGVQAQESSPQFSLLHSQFLVCRFRITTIIPLLDLSAYGLRKESPCTSKDKFLWSNSSSSGPGASPL